MSDVTILKKLGGKGELLMLPRKEYEEFLRKKIKVIKEEPMTPRLKKAFERAEKNYKAGKTLSFDEFSRKLGFTDRPKRS